MDGDPKRPLAGHGHGLWLRPDHLLVEDEDSRLPVLQQHNDWDALGGRGLMLVDALSTRWGSQPCPFGKLVWA